jgi:hypothetical protein
VSPGTVLLFGSALFGVLLVITAVLVWQEARRSGPAVRVYAVEDAVSFAVGHLDPTVLARLEIDGVRRILEWEVFYLQGLTEKDRLGPWSTVAGGTERSVEFICERVATVHGVSYDPKDVRAVLVLEAEYLASIGAIGETVGGDEP